MSHPFTTTTIAGPAGTGEPPRPAPTAPEPPPAAGPSGRGSGKQARPAWLHRPSGHGWITIGIGVLAAVLYGWGLSRNGWANDYYSAAVRAGTLDWKAFLFGSLDPGNAITVDKPPAALWLMALSARIFGFNSWSVLLPEAACGVASVLILHHLVRRWAGDVVAHLAAVAFALTPVAVAMFRYNNPDALLTLLCLGAAWGVWSALETGRTRGLVVSGVLVGLAFTTKMLQAFVVLPAFAGVYLVAGPPLLRRRLVQLAAAAGALFVSAGWWIAVVTLWPAGSRPYIGGSDNNTVLDLVLGYNGLGRIFGQGPGGGVGAGAGAGGPGGGGGFGGAVGWLRMFNPVNGGEISWLLPLALAGLAAGLWLTRRRPRDDRERAGWLLWGGWALLCLVTFSRAGGIFHPYYSVQLAPAVAALAGAAGPALWHLGRTHRRLRWCLPATLLITAAWSVALLGRTPDFVPWLPAVIIAGAAAAVVCLWLATSLRNRSLVLAAGTLGAMALLVGPAAYSIATVQRAVNGPLVAAGPAGTAGAGAGFRGGGPGGETVDAGLVAYLQANRGAATYLVATFGAQSAAPLIIETGEPVIAIGGFSGDPYPTLDQFRRLVADGQVRYLVTGGGGFGAGGRGGDGISQWAPTAGTVVPASAYGGTGNQTLYDLSGAT